MVPLPSAMLRRPLRLTWIGMACDVSVISMAVDVYATVQQYGYHIEVLKDYDEPMDRYAFLLVE